MSDPVAPADDLTIYLKRIGLPLPGEERPPESAQAELEFMLTRISALTDFLHRSNANDSTRRAARLLLSDLELVTAEFRGRASALHDSLVGARASLAAVLDQGGSRDEG